MVVVETKSGELHTVETALGQPRVTYEDEKRCHAFEALPDTEKEMWTGFLFS